MFTLTILYLLMFSQPVGYRVILMCLFWGEGQRAVKVGGGGGSIIYGIPFGFGGKISSGTLSCLLLQLHYLFISFSFLFVFFM